MPFVRLPECATHYFTEAHCMPELCVTMQRDNVPGTHQPCREGWHRRRAWRCPSSSRSGMSQCRPVQGSRQRTRPQGHRQSLYKERITQTAQLPSAWRSAQVARVHREVTKLAGLPPSHAKPRQPCWEFFLCFDSSSCHFQVPQAELKWCTGWSRKVNFIHGAQPQAMRAM